MQRAPSLPTKSKREAKELVSFIDVNVLLFLFVLPMGVFSLTISHSLLFLFVNVKSGKHAIQETMPEAESNSLRCMQKMEYNSLRCMQKME